MNKRTKEKLICGMISGMVMLSALGAQAAEG